MPPGGYGQPAYGYGAAPGPKPDNFLIPAILSTLFCCLFPGIAAIVFAAQVDSKWNQGDFAGAQASAQKARTWTFVSVGLGVVAIVLWVLLVAMADNSTTTYNY